MFEKIKKFYALKLWTQEMVKTALDKNIISEEEYAEIINGEK